MPRSGHHYLRPRRHLWQLHLRGALRRGAGRRAGIARAYRTGDQVWHSTAIAPPAGEHCPPLQHRARLYPGSGRELVGQPAHRHPGPAAHPPARSAYGRRRGSRGVDGAAVGGQGAPRGRQQLHALAIRLVTVAPRFSPGYQPDRTVGAPSGPTARRHARSSPTAARRADGLVAGGRWAAIPCWRRTSGAGARGAGSCWP